MSVTTGTVSSATVLARTDFGRICRSRLMGRGLSLGGLW
jgi:hypothetical protein